MRKEVENKLNEALSLTNGVLTETQIDSVTSLMYAGEWNLSVETLCETLYEYDLPIPERVYELLQDLGLSLDIKTKYWEVLKPQIH